MDIETKYKLADCNYPRQAVWTLSKGQICNGTILASELDYFKVQTEAGDVYRQPDAAVRAVRFVYDSKYHHR